MSHGMILTEEHCNYGDLTKFGRVEITYESGQVNVRVEGFEFAESATCRQSGAKAIAWARDVLTRQLAADMLAPGGNIQCSVD